MPAHRPTDQSVIEEAYNKYKRLMFATASKFTTNIEDQKDIVQTALVRLIKIFSGPRASKDCISAGYIVFTVRSVAIDLLRKQGQEAGHCISMEDARLEEMTGTDGTLDELLPSEGAEQLWAAWPKLTLEERLLLEGKYILGYGDEDLAAILDCKPGSIRMKLTRARRRAIQLMKERERHDEA